MGFWGAELYANDTGADVRDVYMDALQNGLSDDESWEKVLKKFGEYLGTEEEPLFWYAAADTQWRLGRLRPEVKAKAMQWLAQEGAWSCGPRAPARERGGRRRCSSWSSGWRAQCPSGKR